MKLHHIILMAVVGTVLVGCESRTDIANQKMNDIRNKPPRAPEPIPVFAPVPTFMYAANSLRSPFLPYSIAQEIKTMDGRRVYPNESRIKQPLEQFALETLLMKGTMQNRAGVIEALIQTPTGRIENVRRGSYLGPNHGRIVRITPAQIDLLEIVPDGREGYVERPRTLMLLQATPAIK